MKQAIMVVAFGTTVESARLRNINPVVDRIKAEYSDYDVFLAFTSRIIVKRLRDKDEVIMTEIGLLEELIAQDYEKIIVQPLHLIGGEEYDKLKNNVLSYVGQGHCAEIKVGRPLLYFSGQEERPDDYSELIDQFITKMAIPEDEGLLLVGHGGVNIGNASYSLLQLKLWQKGYHNIRIATLECYPELSDTVLPWYDFKGPAPKKIHVHPLLLVAGDHSLNDIFGEDEDSVMNLLLAEGYEVIDHQEGLGAYTTVQDMYVNRVADALVGNYEGRLPHRPHIPNIK